MVIRIRYEWSVDKLSNSSRNYEDKKNRNFNIILTTKQHVSTPRSNENDSKGCSENMKNFNMSTANKHYGSTFDRGNHFIYIIKKIRVENRNKNYKFMEEKGGQLALLTW